MGVPVLALKGNRHAGRVGASILGCVSHHDWVAGNSEQFINVARELSNDKAMLAEIRKDMRDHLMQSSLCDTRAFMDKINSVYREMWRNWCSCSN